MTKQLSSKKEKIEALNVKLIAEERKPPKVEKHYYTSNKCKKCEIDSLTEDNDYLSDISSVMIIYILILNIALILKNNVFRADIFSFLYAFVSSIFSFTKSIWYLIDKISQITYKINNIICANILYWILITLLIILILAVLSFVGYLFVMLIKKVFKFYDTTQSCIFIAIITLINYFSDIIDIKIFNISLITLTLILFIISIIIRIIYCKIQKG